MIATARPPRRGWLLRWTLAAFGIALLVPGAQAATITVTSAADTVAAGGGCTLREALANANADNGAQTDCAAGTGDDTIVFDTAAFPAGTVTTILVGEPLVASTSNINLELTVEGDNRVALDGGNATRVFVSDISFTVLSRLAVRNGRAAEGGGIFHWHGTLRLFGCTLSGNVATGGDGGALLSLSGVRLYVHHTTFSGNSAVSGGAVAAYGTISEIVDSTFAGNTASDRAGSLASSPGSVTLTRSLLAEGAASLGPQCYAGLGGNWDGGGNVQAGDDTSCEGPGMPLAQSNLGPLQDNGNRLGTHLPGGIGVDAYACPTPDPATDVRGVARPQGGMCDAGAVELRYHTLTVTAAAGGSVTSDSLPAANAGGIAACTSAGGSCTAKYSSEGSAISVGLTATPAAGHSFGGWGGACAGAGSNPSATVQMSQARSCSADFQTIPIGTIDFGTLPALDAPEGDGTRTLSIPLTMSQATTGAVTLQYMLTPAAGSTGVVAQDFLSPATGSVTFPAGSTSGVLNFDVDADNDPEADEAFDLAFAVTTTLPPANTEPNALLAPAVAAGLTITLRNDDIVSTIAFGALPTLVASEGNGGTRTLAIPLTVSPAPDAPVTLAYTLAPAAGSAGTVGGDFTAPATGTVEFPALATSATLELPIVADAMVEPDESFVLGFAVTSTGAGGDPNPNAALHPGVAAGLTLGLQNDDSAVMTGTGTGIDENDAVGQVTTTFSLSAPVQGGFTVTYILVAVDATPGVDYVDASYTLAHGGGTNQQHVLTFDILDDSQTEEFGDILFWDGSNLQCTFPACPITFQGGGVNILDDEIRRWVFGDGFE